MTAKQFFPIALFIGVQAFLIQIIDQKLMAFVPPQGNFGFGWIGFQAWAMYFLAGGHITGAIRSFMGYVIGMIASIAIIGLGGFFSGSLGFWSFPLVLLVLVPLIIYCELLPESFNFVPAIFVGAGVFFGCMTYVPGATFPNIFITEAIYCIIGLIFGFVTVSFRMWYESNYINKGEKS